MNIPNSYKNWDEGISPFNYQSIDLTPEQESEIEKTKNVYESVLNNPTYNSPQQEPPLNPLSRVHTTKYLFNTGCHDKESSFSGIFTMNDCSVNPFKDEPYACEDFLLPDSDKEDLFPGEVSQGRKTTSGKTVNVQFPKMRYIHYNPKMPSESVSREEEELGVMVSDELVNVFLNFAQNANFNCFEGFFLENICRWLEASEAFSDYKLRFHTIFENIVAKALQSSVFQLSEHLKKHHLSEEKVLPSLRYYLHQNLSESIRSISSPETSKAIRETVDNFLNNTSVQQKLLEYLHRFSIDI